LCRCRTAGSQAPRSKCCPSLSLSPYGLAWLATGGSGSALCQGEGHS
jgi:hypothetical protein